MNVEKTPFIESFDLAIYGLGYESRSISSFENYKSRTKRNIAIGYEKNQKCLQYQTNKNKFSEGNVEIYEGKCDVVIAKVQKVISTLGEKRIDCLIDITVMSRHRLASIITILLDCLPPKSKITISYNSSELIVPPSDIQPMHHIGPISDSLSGELGSLSKPTSLIFGLGYEKDKALGVYNYFDASYTFLFIPKNSEHDFEKYVIENNKQLIEDTPKSNVFYYDISKPYVTYVDLKSFLLSISESSRAVMIPLGPKILAVISVLIGHELESHLAVWRVSSEHTEAPVERASANKETLLTVTV